MTRRRLAPPRSPGRHEPGRHEPGRHEPGRHEPGRHEPGRHERRPGFTLPELAATLALLGAVAAIALPTAARATDRITVHGAIVAVASACALARSAAIMRGTYVKVSLDEAAATVVVAAGADTILRRALAHGHSLTLSASRPTITYGPTGLGYGASNTRVIARRGSAADTLWTSRLGRVRH